jgi:hypothetical protein
MGVAPGRGSRRRGHIRGPGVVDSRGEFGGTASCLLAGINSRWRKGRHQPQSPPKHWLTARHWGLSERIPDLPPSDVETEAELVVGVHGSMLESDN